MEDLVRKHSCFVIALFLLANWTAGLAQSWEGLPALRPSYQNDFFREDLAYSGSCFNNVLIDDAGRMWLNACGLQRAINSLGLFSFDGYRFQPLEIERPDGRSITLDVKGVTVDGKFFGQVGGREVFLMDPQQPMPEILPFSDTGLQESTIRGIQEVDGTLYVMATLETDTLRLFSLQNGKLVQERAINYSTGFWTAATHNISGDAAELWLAGGTLPIFRLDQQTSRVDTFTVNSFTEKVPTGVMTRHDVYSQSPQVLAGGKDRTYLYLPPYYDSRLYRFDRKQQKFVGLSRTLPDGWVPLGFFQDQVGSICFLFEDADQQYRAIIEDQHGQRYDYSAVLAGQQGIANLVAKDFKEQVYIVGEQGLHSVGVQQSGLIEQGMEGIWISSMIHLSDRQLLVNSVMEGWFIYDLLSRQVQPFLGTDCGTERPTFGKGMKQQIIPDQEGNLWFTSFEHLVKYNPRENTCETIALKNPGQLFALLSPDLAIVQYARAKVSLVDLKRKKTLPLPDWMPDDLGSFLRDILVDSRGIVWIPTNKGLWKLDFDRQQARHIIAQEGFSDYRFASIYEDQEGRIWLGSYFGGLHIYDPDTESVQIIGQSNGLSNNSVMSIIADEAGDVWVGTEYGITILSPNGEVLNTLFQEDGLNMDKFERFDPYRGPEGKLYFGTRAGINIIDPQKLKASWKSEVDRAIYLTEAVYFDKALGREVSRRENLEQLERIVIPAEQPGIQLKFALSSYLEPQKNRYAYKLEGIDQDWTYLGSQPELKISHLPPGKYNLLIRGADFRNNWADESLVVPVHARQFFYKQTWFYLLAALPFLLFAWVWIRNKQQEARRLEIQVAVQTQKIREDKELIEEQARELRQLDQLKSNFFTNISHELRTPITLIKAPLENIVEKYSGQMENRLAQSLRLVLNNAGKLSRLVEELLELSRLDAKKVQLKEVATPLHVFCQQLFYAYAAAADLKNIDYRFSSTTDQEGHYLIDRQRFEKIINNLLSNALKFTPEGGRIAMQVSTEEKDISIEVMDTGRGIPPEDLPHLFDRYFQTRREDISTEGGTGIGLALSKELAERMGGTIRVESEWGKGSTFCLSLPAKKVAVESSPDAAPKEQVKATIPTAVLAKAANPSNKNVPRILIVEDNPEMQVLIQTILAGDYETIVANHGQEAWQWLKKETAEVNDIELILSDIMMPEMDGYTLLKKIKLHPRWQHLPVVMLTARSAEEDKLQALRMGVDDYLMKPFSPRELKARLHNLIKNYKARQSARSMDKSIDISFEAEASADQLWLQEVEQAAKAALDKGLKLTTSILAGTVFLSDRQFARRLKAMTGLTPKAYIQEVKLQKARSLLEHRTCSTVEEVAAAAGYSSGSYLTKSFEERFGKKPGEYF